MSGGGSVNLDALFLGLTRPAMILGVSYVFFGTNLMACLIYFAITSSFKVTIFGAVVHVSGMIMTKKEPLGMEMLFLKMQKFNRCPNKWHHGGVNSYDVF
jgi:type IV secretion system protein VirB3